MTYGFTRNSASTTGVPTFITAPRKVRRMKVRQGTGRGNGNTVRYILVVNDQDTDLFVDVASTFAGEAEKILDLEDIIQIPRDAKVAIAVDKPDGGIDRSPLDCTATVELI